MIRYWLCVCLLVGTNSFAQINQEGRWIAGKTTGALPYLEYGLGADRLGGAKMTYLDTGVVVKVIDSTAGNYTVQLSKLHVGFLPKNNFKKDNNIRFKPYYLSNSFVITGDDRYDYVTITLDEKLPYRSIQQVNPSKLVVDIFGLTSNTNWINHRETSKEIKNVYYEQIEDDVLRVIIELNHAQHWGHAIYYDSNNRLIIRVKQQPKELSLEHLKIAVDAGHGGDNNGASGIRTGILEKHYTLMIAKELEKQLLDKEAKVYMTRRNDASIGMIERTEMIRKEEPDLMLSIHLNSSARDSIRGASTYYRYIGFRSLTKYILDHMVKINGLINFGNIGSFNFALSGPTEYPNCLVEVAFLSNAEDEKLIRDPGFHKEVAKQIVEGIKEWLKSLKDD